MDARALAGGTRIASALLLAAVLLAMVRDAGAQPILPDVAIMLVLEVRDAAGWLSLHQDVLGTTVEAPKLLMITIAAGTGASRSLTLRAPRFDVRLKHNTRFFKVTVTGKLGGGEALTSLAAFQAAVVEAQTAGLENEVVLVEGLTSVAANLVELGITRP